MKKGKYKRMETVATLKTLKDELSQREKTMFSPFATLSESGARRKKDAREQTDYRLAFSIDADRILHSLAYTRYIDKTQVFYLIKNDHITHRVLHVQLVSKIARTIGRFLRLNEDLLEAIALGHDIGHPPFGHDGESFLSELCQENGIGAFHHNLQSFQFLDRLENKGKGWSLCLQTLDGIVCHDGETHNRRLAPETDKTFQRLDAEMRLKKNAKSASEPADKSPVKALLTPMTMEGCVVRMADTIGYVGRDMEDAIRLKIIKRSDLPAQAVDILGETNGSIVFNLVTDIIKTSYEKDYIAFGPEYSAALKLLKDFSLERIYFNKEAKKHYAAIKALYRSLFERLLGDIEKNNHSSPIYTEFLDGLSPEYIDSHANAEITRDFIAGMTDQYFLRQFPEHMRPKPIVK